MRERHYAVARKLKHAVTLDIPVIDMRVFGSCARGDESEDSDIDIFIEIEDLTKQAKEKIRELSWRIGLENSAVISALIFSRDEMENSPLRSSSIVRNIMLEGIPV